MIFTFRAAPDYETAIRNKLGGQLVAATQPQQQINWQGQPKFITDMVPTPQQSQHGYSIHEGGDHFHNGIHQQQAPQQGIFFKNFIFSKKSPKILNMDTFILFSYFSGQGQGQNLTQHQHPASSIYSTSTPELNRINLTYHHQHQMPANNNASVYQMPTQDQIFAELQRLNLFKPPPPYPGTNNANGQHQHVMVRSRCYFSNTIIY